MTGGNAGKAFGLVYEIRDATNGGNEVWALADHFFNAWTARNHAYNVCDVGRGLLGSIGGAAANDIYMLMKAFGIGVAQDQQEHSPVPADMGAVVVGK